jgi:crossover junction endodeoxyribonuclease RuvC
MKILAIDPGSRCSGYAAILVSKNKVHYLGSGVLKFEKNNFLQRVSEIFETTSKHFKNFEYDVLALETLINVKNVNSLAKLSQARGALICAATQGRSIDTYEYSPNLVKSSVAGFGHADKISVQKSLEIIFQEKFKFKTHDESDALAIAYCCALSLGAGFQAKQQKEIR